MVQGVVCGGVAGVQRDHQIGGLIGQIIPDVAAAEVQAGIAVFFRHSAAVGDHILFQIQPNNIRFFPQDLGDIIVDHKGQIGLSAAKIHDAQRFPGIFGQNIVQKLHKAVDLLEFIVFGLDNPALRRQHAEIHQRRDAHALLQQILLFPVVSGRPLQNGLHRLTLEKQLALFGNLQAEGSTLTKGVQLAVVGQQRFQPGGPLRKGQIFVEGLRFGELFQLEQLLPPQRHRTALNSDIFRAGTGIAHRQAAQRQGEDLLQPLPDRFDAHTVTSPKSVVPSSPVMRTGRI